MAGSKFVFDETRNRFVFPQDKSLIVFFEWSVEPGNHVLSAVWKQPDGRTGSISSDVKMDVSGTSMSSYWNFLIVPGMQNGFWTVEIRVDGRPAGSHDFELAGIPPITSAAPATPAGPVLPTLDEIFKKVSPSLVWIHKLDETGRRVATSSGFISAANLITTSFLSIDSAAKVEIEFFDGRKQVVDSVLAFSRNQDWAILGGETLALPILTRGDPSKVAIGERLLLFNEGPARILGGVDIGGRRSIPGFGERIQTAQAFSSSAVGGPSLDVMGHVVGVLGGNTTPGGILFGSRGSFNSWVAVSSQASVTPISLVPVKGTDTAKMFSELLADGTLTMPLSPMPEFLHGGTTRTMPKSLSEPIGGDVSDFSTRDSFIHVYTMWQKRGKLSKGEIGGKIYDAYNRLLTTLPPKKFNLESVPSRMSFSFAPKGLSPGSYRVDITWDGKAVWRTVFRVTD